MGRNPVGRNPVGRNPVGHKPLPSIQSCGTLVARLAHAHALHSSVVQGSLAAEPLVRSLTGVYEQDYMRDLPYDYTTLVENIIDPSHVPVSPLPIAVDPIQRAVDPIQRAVETHPTCC